MKLMLAAVAVFAFAVPTSAQITGNAGSGGTQIQTGQAVPDGQCVRGQTVNGERCVCRRIEVESSSRMSLRTICRTTTQWRQWDRENR